MTDQIPDQLAHPADLAAPSVTGELKPPAPLPFTASELALDPAPAIDISAEQPAGWVDLAVVAAVVGVALVYLYRKLWRRGGRCDGCGQGACGVERVADKSRPSHAVAVAIPRKPPGREAR
ncbi:MAG: hypothetical protein KFB96_21665 [Thiocapsa sp.]|uniref:hypothetical protein n=1 Tax=Thiocapsa sp. TaxID=2024551 RepID=UPI001BCC5C78|nr:hypothetical protein [Thiocapsa sp.]QVL48204.1 MAG: hypothetical protein KFB96_21665 [Thiocapsa sp.]